MSMFFLNKVKQSKKGEILINRINLKGAFLHIECLNKDIKKLIAVQVQRELNLSQKASLSIIIALNDCQGKAVFQKSNYAKIQPLAVFML